MMTIIASPAALEKEAGVRRGAYREQPVGSGERRRIKGSGQPGRREAAPGRAPEQYGGQPLNVGAQLGGLVRPFGAVGRDGEGGRIVRQEWVIDGDGDRVLADVPARPQCLLGVDDP